jgi:hypothetical protein
MDASKSGRTKNHMPRAQSVIQCTEPCPISADYFHLAAFEVVRGPEIFGGNTGALHEFLMQNPHWQCTYDAN